MLREVPRDAWYGCYAQSLRALLVPAVPAHPAKMAWGLALRLLAHVKAEGWLPPGCLVLDPLAGSGVTGLACSKKSKRIALPVITSPSWSTPQLEFHHPVAHTHHRNRR